MPSPLTRMTPLSPIAQIFFGSSESETLGLRWATKSFSPGSARRLTTSVGAIASDS